MSHTNHKRILKRCHAPIPSSHAQTIILPTSAHACQCTDATLRPSSRRGMQTEVLLRPERATFLDSLSITPPQFYIGGGGASVSSGASTGCTAILEGNDCALLSDCANTQPAAFRLSFRLMRPGRQGASGLVL
jgi:hypothetical protein